MCKKTNKTKNNQRNKWDPPNFPHNLMSACYFQMSGIAVAPETTCNVIPTYPPPHPHPHPRLHLVLVVRHARGIPCHSCHVKECSHKTGDFFFFVVDILTCTPRYPRMVGAGDTRTRTNRLVLYVARGRNWDKLERRGLARARDSRAGNALHVIISIHLHERVQKNQRQGYARGAAPFTLSK